MFGFGKKKIVKQEAIEMLISITAPLQIHLGPNYLFLLNKDTYLHGLFFQLLTYLTEVRGVARNPISRGMIINEVINEIMGEQSGETTLNYFQNQDPEFTKGALNAGNFFTFFTIIHLKCPATRMLSKLKNLGKKWKIHLVSNNQ